MVRVSKHHCGQTFSTCLGGWEERSPVSPEDKLTDAGNGEQAFMAIRPKLIGAG